MNLWTDQMSLTPVPTHLKEAPWPLPLKYSAPRGNEGGTTGGLKERMEDSCFGSKRYLNNDGRCGPPDSGYKQEPGGIYG